MSQYLKIILVSVCILLTSVITPPAYATSATVSQQKSATKGKRTTVSGKKKSTSANRKGKAAPANRRTSRKQETSADVKKQQEATQKEIKLTEQQIKENDRSIKKGLNELGKLEGDISASRKKIAETSGKISALKGKIGSLETGILKNESDLKKLRDEYLKAVKKMRVAQKNKSALAFVFASDNFNQALRRMRYLRQFSAWKDRQSAAIASKTSELKTQRDQLAAAKEEQDKTLRLQQTEQTNLQRQYGRQDAIVADLRANGQALQTHLSKKQAEANDLRNRISALIAEEQRKAAEEKARQEAARKAEEQRLAREEKARKEAEAAAAREEELAARKADEDAALLAKAEKEAKAGDAKAKAEAEKLRKKQQKAAEKARKEEEKRAKEQAKREAAAKESARKAKEEEAKRLAKEESARNKASKGSSKNYADARKRTPRSSNAQPANPAPSAVKTASNAGNFSAMKGSLPRPVSGSFKVTSRFGRQSLPDLPDVVYDNPGIDAEVSNGATAIAVYGGKVSGVYMIPGYNTVVIVNHGSYYTVYGNIANPSVKVGDTVDVGHALGRLAQDEDDSSHSSIHFEVWRNREKLNPLEWIR